MVALGGGLDLHQVELVQGQDEDVEDELDAQIEQGQEPPTASILAAASPEEQKQMLGERLFPRIQRMFPDLAGKITDKLLENDNAELVHMLEDQNSLEGKVCILV